MTATTTPTVGLNCFHPEMGEARPASQIHARLTHYGRHWFIRVAPEVARLSGRGIEFECVETAANLVPGSKYVGWSKYKVTERAFKTLCAKFAVSSEMLL